MSPRFIYVVLIASFISLSGAPAVAEQEVRFVSVASEIRVEKDGTLLTTETFILSIPPHAQVHGFTRGFRGKRAAFFGEGGSAPNFQVLLVTRRLVSDGAHAEKLIVQPEIDPEGIRFRLGTEQLLSPGHYEYVFQYRVKDVVLQNAELNVEGILIQFPQVIDIRKERVTIQVFPPELVEPSTLVAAYSVIGGDGVPLGRPLKIAASRSSEEKNRLGEGRPFLRLDRPQGLEKKEAISLSVRWPRGFTEKSATPQLEFSPGDR